MSDLEELFGSDISDDELVKPDDPADLPNQEGVIEEDAQQDHDEMDEMDTKEDDIVENIEIANTGGPLKENPNIFLTKIPFFLGYDPMPWDPNTFDPQFDENDDSEDVLLSIQNTIRWRNHPTLEKQSNTRMVKWSDGSYSLMIGDELFEANINDISKSQFTLLQYHQAQGCFQTVTKFKKNMSFRPHSTSSLTHKKLTRAIAKKHAKTDKTKTLITKEDPDKARNELEKRVNENMKAQRKREAKERALLERTMGDAEYDSDVEASYRRGDSSLLNRLDKYSDDKNDGFGNLILFFYNLVVDDQEDSDDDVQKSRLLQAKRDMDEDMSDQASDVSDKGKQAIHSRKLRIIESDESD